MPRWSDEDTALLAELVTKGLTFRDIATRLKRPPSAVAKKAQSVGLDNLHHRPWTTTEARDATILEYELFKGRYPDRTFDAYYSKRGRIDVEGLELTDYTRLVTVVEGDALICACVHVPQTDPRMWAKALAIGERDHLPTLIIAGDIVTGDMFSHWDIRETWEFDKELESLRLHLAQALTIFPNLVITPGNHITNRITKTTNGHIRLSHMVNMAGLSDDQRSRIATTDIDFIRLNSGGERFLVGHATNYSIIDGKVSVEYASKYETHVIAGNGHRFGHQVSKSGRWHGWDIGTMADPRFMGYAQRAMTKFPQMLQSFCTVRNGTVRVYAAGPPITDWADELR